MQKIVVEARICASISDDMTNPFHIFRIKRLDGVSAASGAQKNTDTRNIAGDGFVCHLRRNSVVCRYGVTQMLGGLHGDFDNMKRGFDVAALASVALLRMAPSTV